MLRVLVKKAMLETSRLSLRAFSDDDLENGVSIFENEEIKQTFMLPDFKTEKEAILFFERIKRMSHDSNHFVYGIYLRERLIGLICDVEIEEASIEIGYAIYPTYWNKGYATESVGACIKELFRMGYTTVRCGYFEENIASGRVMQKCGMHCIDNDEMIEYRGKKHRCVYCEIGKENVS